MNNEGTNLNPKVKQITRDNDSNRIDQEKDVNVEDEIDEIEVFDLIRFLPDPEHPLTLEELSVVNLEDIKIDK